MKRVLLMLLAGCLTAPLLMAKGSIRGHYDVVGAVPSLNSLKKVVFEEFLNFGCPHCNNLLKASRAFRKQHEGRVEFRDIPITFRGQDDAPLRLYYVARRIGMGDQVKEELFKTRFTHGVDVFDQGIVNYLARALGLAKEYRGQRDAEWVNRLIAEGERLAQLYGVTGTPTVVLQHSLKMNIGSYGSMERFAEKLPETIEDLLAR